MQSENTISAQQIIAALIIAGSIQSANYNAAGTPPFSAAGTRLDLVNGNFQTPGLYVDGASGALTARGTIIAQALTMLDALGNTRITFGPKAFTTGPFLDGYGLAYTDPAAPAALGSGIAFGDNGFTNNYGQAMVYANRDASRRSVVSAIADEANDYQQVLAYVRDDVANADISVALTSDDTLNRNELGLTMQNSFGTLAGLILQQPWAGNAQLNIIAEGDLQWNSAGVQNYTPQIWQGPVTPNVAKTVNWANWYKLGRIVFAWGSCTITGAGTAGQLVNIALPHIPAGIPGGRWICGVLHIYDASAVQRRMLLAEWNTSGGMPNGGICGVGDITGGNAWGGVPAIALAVGDQLDWNVCYRTD